MKKSLLFWGLGLLAFCALPLRSHALDMGVSYAVFATPQRPYIEINLEIASASVTFQKVDSTHLQAAVEVLILIKKGEEIANYEKYLLQSPLVEAPRSLLDVKRLAVPNGQYSLEIHCRDMRDSNNVGKMSMPLEVRVDDKLYLSELQLLRGFRPDNSDNPFSKNGYYLEPQPFAFYDRSATLLAFYAEIYHADKSIPEETYLVRYFIEQDKGNGVKNLVSVGTQRKRPASIDALLVQMDISTLTSGNYWLTVELRNQANTLLLQRSLSFQRSNPFLQFDENQINDETLAKQFVQDLDEETLRYSLRAVGTILLGDDPETLQGILKSGDLKQMRFFLFRHFVREDANNPEEAYRKYMETARAADKQFHSGFRYGFETDRGRTYMRFGRPDDLVHVEDDPNAPPYEIWVYYGFPKTKQRNVKFLFYNPTLAGEDFILLHSNARGEINNPRWERVLYAKTAGDQWDGDNEGDATRMQRNVGRNARMYFEDF
jgi:GWxTD domain-containing protein